MKNILLGKVKARSNMEREGMTHMLLRKVVVSIIGVLAVTAFAGDTAFAGSAGSNFDQSASLRLTSSEFSNLATETKAASDLEVVIVTSDPPSAGSDIANPSGDLADSAATIRSSGGPPTVDRSIDSPFDEKKKKKERFQREEVERGSEEDEDEDEERRLEEEEEEQE